MSEKVIINFKAEEDIKEAFKEACKGNFTTPSAELYKFVRHYIKSNESKPINYNSFRNKHSI